MSMPVTVTDQNTVKMSANDVVWAKMRFCFHWPGRIVNSVPPGIKLKIAAKNCCVYFFGTHNYGSVPIENILGYVQNRSKYVTKGRGYDFQEAIKECDSYITNPQAQLDNESRSEVVVKTEFDFVVKQEDDNAPMYNAELVQLDAHTNNVKQQCQNCELLDQKVKELTEKCYFMEKQHETDTKRVISLNQEIDDLKAQVEKLQPESDREYEVERSLGHKKKKGVLYFLVRLKGYDSAEDSWERRENLNCPHLLNRYIKLNDL